MSDGSSPRDNEAGAAGRSESARSFTLEELAEYDGTVAGRPILIAYHGDVYDVSDLFMWMTGQHFWLPAGHDLSGHMREAPHSENLLSRAHRVGKLAGRDR